MEKRVLSELDQLAALCEASEKGFRVAAETARNRGVKVLLKSYARQRARMAGELRAEIQRLGGASRRRPTALAALHRGWIDVRGAMIIGDDNVEDMVFREAVRGERVAVRQFEKAQSLELPEQTRQLLNRMSAQVQAVAAEVDLLRGGADKQLVVRLLDRREDVDQALAALRAAGFSSDDVDTIPGRDLIDAELGQVRVGTYKETLAAGALLGAGVGTLVGLCIGIVAAFIPEIILVPLDSPILGLLFWTLAGTLVGAFVGSIMTSLLARGIHEQDSFWSADLVKNADTLLLIHADSKRAREAAHILAQINAASRAQRVPEVTRAGA